MRFYLFLFIMTTAGLSLSACKKGDVGPQGEPGNANVILYQFGRHEFSESLDLSLPVSRGVVDNSLVLVYCNPVPEQQTTWYPIPGLGVAADYQMRYFLYQAGSDEYTLSIRLLTPDGSASHTPMVTFRKIKVIFAEASTVDSIQASSGNMDLTDYQSVKARLAIRN